MTYNPADLGAPLTEREVEILAHAARGLGNAALGRRIGLTENTVKTHASRAFRKLGAHSRAHAVTLAFSRGLLRLGHDGEVIVRPADDDHEPRDQHDLRCTVWTSDHLPCNCRDALGHSAVITSRDPRQARDDAEQAWNAMTLCERAEQLDTIAAKGA